MTVKELIEHLQMYNPEQKVMFTYDGLDTFTYVEIKAVEEINNVVVLDSSEYEARG